MARSLSPRLASAVYTIVTIGPRLHELVNTLLATYRGSNARWSCSSATARLKLLPLLGCLTLRRASSPACSCIVCSAPPMGDWSSPSVGSVQSSSVRSVVLHGTPSLVPHARSRRGALCLSHVLLDVIVEHPHGGTFRALGYLKS